MSSRSTIRDRLIESKEKVNLTFYQQCKYFKSKTLLKNMHTLLHRIQELQSYGLYIDPEDWDGIMVDFHNCCSVLRGMGEHQHDAYFIDYKNNLYKYKNINCLPKF